MKKKNGFTLIELLVTIALMLSILGIAIVSFINISDKKKTESWQQVKAQVETAAVEYFTANEYMFEGLSDKSSGYISVGKLEEEDYISKVTNPETGKSVNKCALVRVDKNGNKLTATYADETGDASKCNGNYMAYTAETGGPTGEMKYYKENGTSWAETNHNNGWFNIASLGEKKKLKVCIKADTKGNGAIYEAKIGESVATQEENNYCVVIDEDIKKTNVLATLINVSGKSWKQTINIFKDTNKPEGIMDINSSKTDYNSNVVRVKNIFVKDNLKNVTKVKIKNNYYNSFVFNNIKLGYDKKLKLNNNENSFEISKSLDGKSYDASALGAKVYDEAGNEGNITSGNYLVYKSCDETNKSTTTGSYGACTKECGGGTKTRTDTINVKDKYVSSISCPGDGATKKVEASCNTRGCCDKTEEYGNITWENNGKWSSTCNSSDKRTRTGTINLRSAYDHRTSCGTAAKSDSKNCDLKPSITKIQFRYNRDKCPKGWVEIRYKDINMAKYTTTFKYSHSSQGTTATTMTDESSSYDETFCRGYGSVSKNIMSYTVTIYNETSNEHSTYSGKCKYSKMYNKDKSLNSSWHDCD